jgi:hypothetical protein
MAEEREVNNSYRYNSNTAETSLLVAVWYRTAIPRAEQLYEDYLAARRKEMGL